MAICHFLPFSPFLLTIFPLAYRECGIFYLVPCIESTFVLCHCRLCVTNLSVICFLLFLYLFNSLHLPGFCEWRMNDTLCALLYIVYIYTLSYSLLQFVISRWYAWIHCFAPTVRYSIDMAASFMPSDATSAGSIVCVCGCTMCRACMIVRGVLRARLRCAVHVLWALQNSWCFI